MPYPEFLSWCAYRRKRGPLNPLLRNDAALARISFQIHRALGGTKDLSDFMPWAEDEAEVTDVLTILGGAIKHG